MEGQQGHYKIIFSEVHNSISQGNSVSEAMAEHKKAFDRSDIMMVETAEMSGKLPECFKMLANWYEFRNRLRRIMIKGLILPCLVLSFAAFVLPFPSMLLGNITLGGYLFGVFKVLAFFYLSLLSILFIYKLTQKKRNLKNVLDNFILRIPIVGQAVLQLSVCRYCRSFNMLYKAGVPITESLSQASKLTGNIAVSGFFEGGAKSATAGNTAFEGFSERLPSEYLNLWQIGEETGELEKTVDKIAEISGDKAELIFTELARWFPIIVYALICVWMIIKIFEGYANIYSTQGIY
jgi:type IV pilus assembly protein PilC